jgi:hypothetical protein
VDEEPGRRLLQAIELIGNATRGRSSRGVSHHDVGGDLGTIESDEAIGFDPMPVLRALADARAPAVVMGQVAGILHGSEDLTGDLDLLWPGEQEDAGAMFEAFASLGARIFDDDLEPLELDVAAFGRPKVLFRAPSAAGDCCTPRLPWGGLDVSAFAGRSCVAEVDGVPVRYLAMPDLMAMRRRAGRPKDLRRLTELHRLAKLGDRHRG